MIFTVVLTKDEDGGVSASVPALPGCHTWGRTRRAATANAEDAIATYLEGLRVLGEDPPEELDAVRISVKE